MNAFDLARVRTLPLIDASGLAVFRNTAGHYSPLTSWIGIQADTRKYMEDSEPLGRVTK